MRAAVSFVVRPRLPKELAVLEELAYNLRWSWDARTQEVFRAIDSQAWEASGHDPVRLLGLVPSTRLEALSADPAFLSLVADVGAGLESYLGDSGWFADRSGSPLTSVAYFSPEFGIAAALPQYSGGLGVLAGDHLKAASELGVPVVGVGLLYRHAYFHQELDTDGWQLERYPTLDPHTMPLEFVDKVTVDVSLADASLLAQVWRAQVGRVPLYLLDTDLPGNDDPERQVTDRLYGGDTEHRLRQEILLGMGGVRALEAMGALPQLFHMNEGHAGFCTLERIRAHRAQGLSFDEAVEAVRSSTLFTTHTPVPAGIDRFPRVLMERYFTGWADDVGISIDRLMALGHEPGEPLEAPFNMALLSLRLSGMANAVSKLHGEVSRRMFGPLWPGVPANEAPVTSVTNGVHARTWVSPEMSELLERCVQPTWPEAGPDQWNGVNKAGDDEVWRIRMLGRDRLVTFVRAHLRAAAEARGESDMSWCEAAFDPTALTLVWSRRFAAYKRATLLLSQRDRLRRLLADAQRPVQLVFAGKAHPADQVGKEMIKVIVQACRQPDLRQRMAFIEDYDMRVGRILSQGADVWLNTPRRPQEACGTSGMKAALNGGLNCSILDGWYDELYNGHNGWAIPSAERHEDLDRRDAVEASSLFELLEREIVPLFYDRGSAGPTPRGWTGRIKASLGSLGHAVSASRMVESYVHDLYEPLASRATVLAADGHARAKALAHWKQATAAAWPQVRIETAAMDGAAADLGALRTVTATVVLGPLRPEDVEVQLLHGPSGPDGDLEPTTTVVMQRIDGAHYTGTLTCNAAGRYGYTVRVVPRHPDLGTFAELGCVTWV